MSTDVPLMVDDTPVVWAHGMDLLRTPMLIRCPMCDVAAPTMIIFEMGATALLIMLLGSYFLTPFLMIIFLVFRFMCLARNPDGVREDDFVPRSWKDVRHKCRSCSYDLGLKLVLGRWNVFFIELVCLFIGIGLIYDGTIVYFQPITRDADVARYNQLVRQWKNGPMDTMNRYNFSAGGVVLHRSVAAVTETDDAYVAEDESDVEPATSIFYTGFVSPLVANGNGSDVVRVRGWIPGNGTVNVVVATDATYMLDARYLAEARITVNATNTTMVLRKGTATYSVRYVSDVSVEVRHSLDPYNSLMILTKNTGYFGRTDGLRLKYSIFLWIVGAVLTGMILFFFVRSEFDTRRMNQFLNVFRSCLGMEALLTGEAVVPPPKVEVEMMHVPPPVLPPFRQSGTVGFDTQNISFDRPRGISMLPGPRPAGGRVGPPAALLALAARARSTTAANNNASSPYGFPGGKGRPAPPQIKFNL